MTHSPSRPAPGAAAPATSALQEDLRRARIEPGAEFINQSLLHNGSGDLQSHEH